MQANLRSILLIVGLLVGANTAFAADRFWVGPNNGSWHDVNNWSTSSGGTGPASIPGTQDIAIFDASNSTNCVISSTVNVKEIMTDYFYGNTIFVNANLNVVNLNIYDGILQGGSNPILVTNTINIDGGTFTSTSGLLTMRGSTFSFTNGAFQANNGTVLLTSIGTTNTTITGTPTFYNLRLSGGDERNIEIANTVRVNNTLSLEGSYNLSLNSGTINLYGDINCLNTATAGGGTALIDFKGANQTITGATAANVCRLPKVTFSSTGTISLLNTITLTNNFTNNAANALNAGTSTVVFTNGAANPYTISGTSSTTFNDLEINPSLAFTLNVNSGSSFTVAGNLNMTGSGAVNLAGGSIYLQKDLNVTNPNVAGGTSSLVFSDNATQNITGSGLSSALLPAITIAKGTGTTLTLPSSIKVGGNWTYTSGTIDATTNTSTVIFANNNLTVSGTHTLRNVNFLPGLSETQFTIANGTLSVSGALTLEGSAGLVLNGSTIAVAGNVVNNNSGNTVTAGGTVTLQLNGTGAQSLSGRATAGEGKYPNIEINKASGTLSLTPTTISLGTGSDWTYTRGTVNAGVSTLKVFDGGTVFSGSHTLNKLSFAPINSGTQTYTINPGTTITLNSDLLIEGNPSADLNFVNGEIKVASRDITTTNTSSLTGGTTTFTMSGSANQIITGSGAVGQGSLPKLKVNKPNGTLFITNKATVSSELIMTQGTVDMAGDQLTLGTSTSNIGTLTYTSGVLSNGTFSRWYNTSGVADNTNASLFPVGSSQDFRPMYIATNTNPTSGGTLSVTHDPTSGTVDNIDQTDGSDVVNSYSNATWNISSGNGLTSGEYNLRINAANVMTVNDINNLRITVAGATIGTHGTVTGSAANPSITRTGLSLADLSNDFRIGSIETDPLPVELVSFEAKKVNESVELTWETASEKNNDFFTVERSLNGSDFTAIAKIKGAGTTSAPQLYNSVDEKPLAGISYYRLIQTDFDGTASYSKIVKVSFGNKAAVSTVVTYPNPATDNLQVKIEGLNGNAILEITDMTGKLMLRNQVQTTPNPTLDVANFPKGIYQIRVYSETGTAVSKFIKQ